MNSIGGSHYVVVNGFSGSLPFYLDKTTGDQIPQPEYATTNMFTVVDPGRIRYTLDQVIADYNSNNTADMKAIYIFS